VFDDDIEPTRTSINEMIYVGPDDIEIMFKFAVTVVVVPATGKPTALIHFGLSPLGDDSETIHNVMITKNQFLSMMEDMRKVETTLENM
jgi:hypothetical protein